MTTLRIGTRRSALAMYQTNLVAARLRSAHPGATVEIVEIDTKGDKIRDVPLPEIGGKGLFTFEIEQQLLSEDIELAVHSLKDLPSALPDGLIYAGSLERGTPYDAFVSETYHRLRDVPEGETIATGSVRRRAQLLAMRPDLEFVDLRGNIDTRLKKLTDHGWAGIIMAATALERLELSERITQRLGAPDYIPAVGQGAIGLEIKQGREDVAALLAPILHAETVTCVQAERRFMAKLEGGCSAPLAAYCEPHGDSSYSFHAWVADPGGARVMRDTVRGSAPCALADTMADQFLANGARQLMRGE
ncbi:MAG: hydroxymethylbilane synthase [Myxococcota bacterium]